MTADRPTAEALGRGATVGIVGIGAMGLPISERLLAAGFRVVGTDVAPARVAALEAAGGAAASSAAEVARTAAVVLTILPSAAALDTVVDDLVRGAASGASGPLVVEMSTLDLPSKARARARLQAIGGDMVDSTLSGTAVQVAWGDLVAYASGDDDDLDQCEPVLAAFTRAVHRLGSFGNGTRTKLVANLLVAVHIVAAAEALALAERAGLDLERTLAALTDGAGTSRMLEIRGPMMAARRYHPASMSLGLFAKDVRLIGEFAAEVGAATPLFTPTAAAFRAALGAGDPDADTSGVHALVLGDERIPGSPS